MAEMGKYCKAYYAKDFRALPGWQENLDNLRPETDDDGRETGAPRTELKDDDILYLQENYTVTDGIFIDEHILFDDVTDEWKQACHEQLSFEIPVYEPIEIRAADGNEDDDGGEEEDEDDDSEE
jgi:hypothetical protein